MWNVCINHFERHVMMGRPARSANTKRLGGTTREDEPARQHIDSNCLETHNANQRDVCLVADANQCGKRRTHARLFWDVSGMGHATQEELMREIIVAEASQCGKA